MEGVAAPTSTGLAEFLVEVANEEYFTPGSGVGMAPVTYEADSFAARTTTLVKSKMLGSTGNERRARLLQG